MPFTDSVLQSLAKVNEFLQHSWHIRATHDHTRDHTDSKRPHRMCHTAHHTHSLSVPCDRIVRRLVWVLAVNRTGQDVWKGGPRTVALTGVLLVQSACTRDAMKAVVLRSSTQKRPKIFLDGLPCACIGFAPKLESPKNLSSNVPEKCSAGLEVSFWYRRDDTSFCVGWSGKYVIG